MEEYQAGVDEVKGLCGQGIGDNVMTLGLNHGPVKRSTLHEKAQVDVSDQHMAAETTSLCKPCRNRPTTTTDFPALPAWADSSRLKVADRPWVVERLQTGETLAGLLCSI